MVSGGAWLAFIFTAILFVSELPPLIWEDNDRKDIPEPEARVVSMTYDWVAGSFGRPAIKVLDVPWHLRRLTRRPIEAQNVNAVDEVPNSSWYTNRNFLFPMSPAAAALGPHKYGGPSMGAKWTVTSCKTQGITPGLQIRDARGDLYFIKFDPPAYPDLMTAAEVIGAKIFHAAGYNVPENFIVDFETGLLEVPNDMDCALNGKVSIHNGKVRAVASKFLDGKPKGPFSYTGWRADDPNDVIPHENRRELRGLRVIASFINHNDLKQLNTLDMYVEENGRRFLRHHLIDFGATLGSATIFPKGGQEGREYIFDPIEILKSTFSLGLYRRPATRDPGVVHPSVGHLDSDAFLPNDWKPNLPIAPFLKMTERDAYWGAKIVAAFSDEQLKAIIQTGGYSDPAAADELLRILKIRRDKIAAFWFRRSVAPLDRFRYEVEKLVFDDLAVEGGYDCKTCPVYDIVAEGSKTIITRVSPGWPRQRVVVHSGRVNGKLMVLGLER
jgi:hypothetical protein